MKEVIKEYYFKAIFFAVIILVFVLLFKYLMIPNYKECLDKGFSKRYCITTKFLR